ncbi:hypothetical protein MOJ79_10695 [Calidifontimicrobium sp. SYSU G02091]|uniref:hypothetical protein n=1 Tax=Calidifontimicrobium sp. SYSU G02091 TaxID=2926421 RepID=UPI001F52DE4F|nr:hypothetical protein [Calidifontimicrobium sp. SYSU G02091]MCI1192311.1 hypothetical protein [Calidifontimicrobium sp. SYSU G02091]
MAKPNYSFEKRQRELAKKKKKEEKEAEKRARKAAGAAGGTLPGDATDDDSDERADTPDAGETDADRSEGGDIERPA